MYTPSAIDAKAILTYKTEIASINANMVKELNSTLYSFRDASTAGALTQLTDAEWIRLNTTFADAAKSVKAIADPAKVGTGTHTIVNIPCLNLHELLTKNINQPCVAPN